VEAPAHPVQALSNPAPGPAETCKGEPAVHVHIGRIEVKALMEVAPKAEKRAPRVSTLEDYLRRRAEGNA
jgi:hypothetical protein